MPRLALALPWPCLGLAKSSSSGSSGSIDHVRDMLLQSVGLALATALLILVN